MRKRKTRTDTTAAERYRHWEENARAAGKRRLAVWLPAEAFERLQALAQTHGLTLAQTLTKVTLEHRQTVPSELGEAPTAARAKRVGTNAEKSVGTNVSTNGLSPQVRELVRSPVFPRLAAVTHHGSCYTSRVCYSSVARPALEKSPEVNPGLC
jgi:hypothetical protein